jgi:hypothetical protein
MLTHNKLKDVKFISLKELDLMKPSLSVMYQLSYKNFTKHEFYKNLPHSLKDKILLVIT